MSLTPKEKSKSVAIRAKKEVVTPEQLPEIFVDGMSNFLLGNYVSKLTLYSDAGRDKRAAVVRIAIPTVALLETCKRILAAAKKNEEGMNSANLKISKRLSTVLHDVNFPVVGMEESE